MKLVKVVCSLLLIVGCTGMALCNDVYLANGENTNVSDTKENGEPKTCEELQKDFSNLKHPSIEEFKKQLSPVNALRCSKATQKEKEYFTPIKHPKYSKHHEYSGYTVSEDSTCTTP